MTKRRLTLLSLLLLSFAPLLIAQEPVSCATRFTSAGAYCNTLNEYYSAVDAITQAIVASSPDAQQANQDLQGTDTAKKAAATALIAKKTAAARAIAADPDATPDPSSTTTMLNRRNNNFQMLVRPVQLTSSFVTAFAPTLPEALASLGDMAQQWDLLRLDRDGSTTSNSTASTDLVSRPGVSEFLSAAEGTGLFSETTAGNTGTIHVNVGGFKSVLETGSVLDPVTTGTTQKQSAATFSLRNLDLTASFDLNNTSDSSTVATSGAANAATTAPSSIFLPSSNSRWSGMTARYAVTAPYDPSSPAFRNAWLAAFDAQTTITPAGDALGAALSKIKSAMPSADENKKQGEYAKRFIADAAQAQPLRLSVDFEQYCEELQVLYASEDTDFASSLNAARLALNAYEATVQGVIATAAQTATQKDPPFLLEYTFSQPVDQPPTHLVRLILSKQPKAASTATPPVRVLYTLNAAAEIYHGALPAGAAYGRFRDAQISGEIDRGFGTNNATIVSGSIYYQYQMDPTVLNITAGNLAPGTSITLPSDAQVLLGTSGSTVIGQVKTTINLKSGLKIPIAFKWASRTDLLDSMDKVGQIGITYDFSSFSSLLTGKAQSTGQ